MKQRMRPLADSAETKSTVRDAIRLSWGHNKLKLGESKTYA